MRPSPSGIPWTCSTPQNCQLRDSTSSQTRALRTQSPPRAVLPFADLLRACTPRGETLMIGIVIRGLSLRGPITPQLYLISTSPAWH